ncbi:MAG: hypothetical protein A3J62_04080 [Candidatus Buchananbacteria bacterium RIFCSPHIGHO2_02_FULL_38_8]|uniref:Uncharacterized protein n=2 Tax=Candidatus Buchananiibacteriota TaxID=1817903 RepID=A0A1G1XYU2_9BACT|nr:hypothetical protein [uncultured bacterium]OGY44487.1 MAG: hypothetical protein A2731_02995 [Candidatus Buchananbacteria bacterium RIFCSPHIGHO2_01_FULL_39_8]OGY47191.1 MAG: hypothetical protein A3J62_04080 [Candidatus Buchananbacteria bacterium RIFCSPHIGHO2_02_FULL_38_8]
MNLTLPHHTTQENAIKTIENKLNEVMNWEFPKVEIIDPEKEWEDNLLRFSFVAQVMMIDLEFAGTVLVTDDEAILEADLPGMITTFVSEDKIRQVITREFNKLFNI